jgi:predicted dehydrogenase
MATLKAAVIGLGGISGAHLAQWKAAKGVKLVAGADVSEAAVAKAAEAWGIRGYTDWKAMLKAEEPNMVSVCTPPAMHKDMVLECLKHGISVICEKPLSHDVADSEAMVKAAKKAEKQGVYLMPAYCHRFHPHIETMKALIEKGKIGKPLTFRCVFGGYVDMATNHRAKKAIAGGGALMDNGAHAVDLYRYLLGDVANVNARAGCKMQDLETDDLGAMLFEGANGCYGEIVVAYSLPGPHCSVQVIGSEATLDVSDYWGPAVKMWTAKTGAWTDVPVKPGDRFAGEFKSFIDTVKGKAKLRVTAEDGLAVQRILDAAYRAAEGTWVEVCA